MARPHHGLFVTFEGIDGSGKTTQLRLLVERLERGGHRVLQAVEPGGTAIGRKIREILLDKAHHHLTPRAELLLYFASRAQNVEEVIIPALDAGSIVVCDRFTDSTLAYQGYGRELGAEPVLALDAVACQGLEPDLTVLIDLDEETALARAAGRGSNRMDEQPADFYRRTRQAFLEIARAHPERVRVVDGRGSAEEVAGRVWDAIVPSLGKVDCPGPAGGSSRSSN